jgi:hypothetical protein
MSREVLQQALEVLTFAKDDNVGWTFLLPEAITSIKAALAFPDPVLAEREACALVAMEFRRGAGSAVCADVAAVIRQRSQS